jgi:RES domain-containing protein
LPLDVDSVKAGGVWFRHIPHRGSVWWRADPAPDGRWQRGAAVAGFYLADSRETAWAEWRRALAELGLRPEAMLPRDLWRMTVSVDGIADLSDEDRLVRVGLQLPRPSRGEWASFQAVGEELHAEGWRGVLAPSAAREGQVLCLFREEEKIAGVKAKPPPAIHRHPPVGPA